MNSDRFNPIFVLHYQPILRNVKNPVALVGLVVVFSCLAWIEGANPSGRPHEDMQGGNLIGITSLGFLFALVPVVKLAQRTIEQDLIHFTALTQRQIINGYLFSSALSNLLICVCGFFIFSVSLIKTPSLILEYLFNVTCVFTGTEAVVILLTPIYAIVKKLYHLTGAMFITFIGLFSLFSFLMFVMFSAPGANPWVRIAYFSFVLTAPLFGYYAACVSRYWKGAFFEEVTLLTVMYVYYFFAFLGFCTLLFLIRQTF